MQFYWCSECNICSLKGQLISKGLLVSSILPKNERPKDLFIKNRSRTVVTLVLFYFDFLWVSLYFTLVPKVKLFPFIFCKNWRHQKDISTLTDLWHYQKYQNGAIFFREYYLICYMSQYFHDFCTIVGVFICTELWNNFEK